MILFNKNILLLMLMLISFKLSAQYSKDKIEFNYKTYTPSSEDLYKPFTAGLYSFIMPGVGQMYCDEPSRGLKIMACRFSSYILFFSGLAIVMNDSDNENTLGGIMVVTSMISIIGIQIWATKDAVRVAKVKNLAFRDKKKTVLLLNLNPGVQTVRINSNINPGITAKLKF